MTFLDIGSRVSSDLYIFSTFLGILWLRKCRLKVLIFAKGTIFSLHKKLSAKLVFC